MIIAAIIVTQYFFSHKFHIDTKSKMNVVLLFLFSFYADEHPNVEPSSTPAILGVYTTQIIVGKLKSVA